MSTDKDNLFYCNVCGKPFIKWSNCVLHHRTHVHDKDYHCPSCPATFRQKQYLKRHQRVHNNEGVKCTVCGASFGYRLSYANHKRVHMPNYHDWWYKERVPVKPPFSCKTCGQLFVHNSHMKLHMTVHQENRPCVCEDCGAAFKCPGHLSLHKTNVHEGFTAYGCDQCDKMFVYKRELESHKNEHMAIAYVCSECDKMFADKTQLDSHQKTHNIRQNDPGSTSSTSRAGTINPSRSSSTESDFQIVYDCESSINWESKIISASKFNTRQAYKINSGGGKSTSNGDAEIISVVKSSTNEVSQIPSCSNTRAKSFSDRDARVISVDKSSSNKDVKVISLDKSSTNEGSQILSCTNSGGKSSSNRDAEIKSVDKSSCNRDVKVISVDKSSTNEVSRILACSNSGGKSSSNRDDKIIFVDKSSPNEVSQTLSRSNRRAKSFSKLVDKSSANRDVKVLSLDRSSTNEVSQILSSSNSGGKSSSNRDAEIISVDKSSTNEDIQMLSCSKSSERRVSEIISGSKSSTKRKSDQFSYTCKDCNKMFPNGKELNSHVQDHVLLNKYLHRHAPDSKSVSKTVLESNERKPKLTMNHLDQKKKPERSAKCSRKKLKSDHAAFVCDECHKAFFYQAELNIHLNEHAILRKYLGLKKKPEIEFVCQVTSEDPPCITLQ